MDNNSKTIGYLMTFCAGILWGTIGLFVKLLTSVGSDVFLISFIRLFCAFFLLIPIMIVAGLRSGTNLFRIDRGGLLHCLILGVFTQATYNFCYNSCIQSVGMATASILLYTAPVFVFIISHFLFKEEIRFQKIFSLVLNLLGCFLMVTGGNLNNLKMSLIGIILGLGSAFFYSMITVIGKVASGNLNPITVVFYSFMFGFITLAVFTKPWESILEISSVRFWMYSFGFGLIPTVGSYLFYLGGISKGIELSKATILASVEPIVATTIGVILFHEKLGLVNLIGIAMLMFSIIFMNIRLKKEKSIEP